ncbi:DUF1028 domain-containing protein [Halobacteriales archaeon QH_7_69_31]|nr:MAG: DUF1028 domain-containing protein [Halobacteriales archaeon QH_7_69_31]
MTTRLVGVGTLCPFASEHGAVATQSLVNVELGRRGVEYLEDGLAVADALEALLNADEGRASRQLHGIDADGSFAFSGEESKPWFGHRDGSDAVDGHYTVAGNLLTGEAVVDAVADAYESTVPADEAGPATPDAAPAPLPARLVEALAAGHEAGGDKRTDLTVQSAALLVEDTEERPFDRGYTDLRVDATETPIVDLRETYDLAVEGHRDAIDRYEDAYEEDEMSETSRE